VSSVLYKRRLRAAGTDFVTAIVLKALEIRKYFTVALSWDFRVKVSATQGFEGGGSTFFPPVAGPLFLLPSIMRWGRGCLAPPDR
jgi:hypothetical protein